MSDTTVASAELLRTELNEARLAIAALRGQVRKAQREVGEYRMLWKSASGEADRAREQLIAIRRSRSWKVTRVLRIVKRRRKRSSSS